MAQELTNYDKVWAEQAERAVAQAKVNSGTFLSARGGVLKYGEAILPGNQVACIVLDFMQENTFYAGKFDPDKPASPLCYAFGRDPMEMAPHESMRVDLNYFIPQSSDCPSCPHNVYGTADKGKGKACQNRMRLALIAGGEYIPKPRSRDFDLNIYTDPKDILKMDIIPFKLPVTSVHPWSKYVNQVAAACGRPPAGVLTRMYLEPHEKYQYTINFELIEPVADELAQAVMRRQAEAEKGIVQGYQVPEERAPTAQPQGSLKGLRR